MESTTIVLPPSPASPSRPSLPLLAAIVPVVAGVVLWAVTGSLFALCFAALGPLMLLASFLDGIRTRRRDRRRGEAEADAAWQRADAELIELHAEERAGMWRRHPDAAACLSEQPLRGPEPPTAETALVLGRGVRMSAVRASGGDDDRARAFRERASRLDDAPVTVPIGRGVSVRAPQPIGAAVLRALIVQLCLRFTPSQLALLGDGLDGLGLAELPHASSSRRSAFRLVIGAAADVTGDARLSLCAPGTEPPDGVTAVLDCTDPLRARLRTPDGVQDLVVEGISLAQARAIAADSAARGEDVAELPERVALHELDAVPDGGAGLAAALGRGERGDVVVDLVEDGPHAIVTGMTGTGKSELLVSWVTAIAGAHGPDRVNFVLADFKGGTAFDPLRELPQVAAVITDLDDEGARRGVESLTAELRRRERALAEAGVRDIHQLPSLPRLVIVVDEFAALLQEHADLGAVFTDVAARGRALGMHLVLGTQRAAGVIRDALAANCPLRVSLRVADAADSRLVIGSDAASAVPGGPESRGLAFVRRPQDAEAVCARIALTGAADVRAASLRWPADQRPRSPWLPALPEVLALNEVAPTREGGLRHRQGLVLGVADEPDRQRQPVAILEAGRGLAIIGGPGAGKTTALRLLAAQQPAATVIPADTEGAWDVVQDLLSGAARPPLVLCDDLDLLAASYPPEYALEFVSAWEQLVRAVPVAVTVSRTSGAVARVVDALPRRATLRLPGRAEHLAAGGDPEGFRRDRPAGRARIDGREVQLCWVDDGQALAAAVSDTPRWRPQRTLCGVVTPAARQTADLLRIEHPRHRVIGMNDAASGLQPSETPVILVADPEEWRMNWAVTQRLRAEGELLIAAECPGDLRQLAGVRTLPPFARVHAGRAWVTLQGGVPRRVLLPGALA
ncbi:MULTISPECIES: FtsK/SpoIIIE domain-containing protein [unclassified Microbacterium]|uniref:FtsK/SpoIIIE domain-containing protein n=1 Tax=unclassified Microbacterium TaxID=2609290 RepID=UPI0012FAE2FA|nr:FtsK/SpoIIIE domain-containing protein [Microbacterium sp. MAH-37]MVQ41690.1 cell division protein FtsK [Microbacterium sp. MAH-37]